MTYYYAVAFGCLYQRLQLAANTTFLLTSVRRFVALREHIDSKITQKSLDCER